MEPIPVRIKFKSVIMEMLSLDHVSSKRGLDCVLMDERFQILGSKKIDPNELTQLILELSPNIIASILHRSSASKVTLGGRSEN